MIGRKLLLIVTKCLAAAAADCRATGDCDAVEGDDDFVNGSCSAVLCSPAFDECPFL